MTPSATKPSPINQWLNQYGLLLCAFQWVDLPSIVSDATYQALPKPIAKQIDDRSILVLLANGGPSFWRALQRTSFKNNLNPVDEFSASLAHSFHDEYLSDSSFTQLYPTPKNQSHIPLMRLGGLAGWNTPSPLGLGLHPKFGPWSAYRAAWVTQSTQLPSHYFITPKHYAHNDSNALLNTTDLCSGCAAPCVSHCPADAVKLGEYFNTDACYQHSRPVHSDCHQHCAARRACPIGQDYQYDNNQLTHHMSMRWRNVL